MSSKGIIHQVWKPLLPQIQIFPAGSLPSHHLEARYHYPDEYALTISLTQSFFIFSIYNITFFKVCIIFIFLQGFHYNRKAFNNDDMLNYTYLLSAPKEAK